MMSRYKIHKVDTLPSTLEADAIYLVRNILTNQLVIAVADNGGIEVYTTGGSGSNEEVEFIIASLMNQPNGVAGVDSNGVLSTAVDINGQDAAFTGPNGELLWQDNVSIFTVKAVSGATNPSFGVITGNIQGLLFNAAAMNQVWCDFHVEHDYAMGTKMYPHVHWMPITTHTGTVRWSIEYTVAKGHGQGAFHAPVTIYIEQTVSVNSNKVHLIAEASDAQAIPATYLEPDSFVKVRVFRDAAHPNDTFPEVVHAWCCDLHYQMVRLGTVNKAPNFYGT